METIEIIIYKYIELINEYLQHMKQSEALKTIPNSTYVICIGLNSILHIFKIVFHNTKNIDTTFFHCQKAFYCYLEYIEQMNKTFSLHNLNNLDAITFIYKNSLNDMQNTNYTKIQNKVTETKIDDNLSHSILENISLFTKKILFYSDFFELETDESLSNSFVTDSASPTNHNNGIKNNKFIENFTIEQLSFINNHFMKRFFLLTFHNNRSFIYQHITNIKKALSLDFNEYCEFLKQIYRILKKRGCLPSDQELNDKYIFLFLNDENKEKMEKLKNEKRFEEISKMIFYNIL